MHININKLSKLSLCLLLLIMSKSSHATRADEAKWANTLLDSATISESLPMLRKLLEELIELNLLDRSILQQKHSEPLDLSVINKIDQERAIDFMRQVADSGDAKLQLAAVSGIQLGHILLANLLVIGFTGGIIFMVLFRLLKLLLKLLFGFKQPEMTKPAMISMPTTAVWWLIGLGLLIIGLGLLIYYSYLKSNQPTNEG